MAYTKKERRSLKHRGSLLCCWCWRWTEVPPPGHPYEDDPELPRAKRNKRWLMFVQSKPGFLCTREACLRHRRDAM